MSFLYYPSPITYVTVNDADYTIPAGVNRVAVTSITAARTITLPAASANPLGFQIEVMDATSQGASWWHPIKIASAGSDTINRVVQVQLDLPFHRAQIINPSSSAYLASISSNQGNDHSLLEDDFVGGGLQGLYGYRFDNTGGGSSGLQISGFPGRVSIGAGSTANNRVGLSVAEHIVLGGVFIRAYARVLLKTLGSVSDTYTASFGLSEILGTTTDPVDGAYFQYDIGSSTFSDATRWQILTSNNSTRTIPSNAAFPLAVADTFVNLGVEVDGSAPYARFFLNGSQVGADITTNIPSGSNRASGLQFSTRKGSAGSTSFEYHIDFWKMYYRPITPRF